MTHFGSRVPRGLQRAEVGVAGHVLVKEGVHLAFRCQRLLRSAPAPDRDVHGASCGRQCSCVFRHEQATLARTGLSKHHRHHRRFNNILASTSEADLQRADLVLELPRFPPLHRCHAPILRQSETIVLRSHAPVSAPRFTCCLSQAAVLCGISRTERGRGIAAREFSKRTTLANPGTPH